MMMSVGGLTFSAVGIRNSDFGLLEFTWNPRSTRKWRDTVPGFPRVIDTISGADMVTEGIFFPGMSSCAKASHATIANRADCQGWILDFRFDRTGLILRRFLLLLLGNLTVG